MIGDGGTTDRAEEDGVELRIERLPGVVSPVRAFDDGGIDFLCVREKAVAAFALP